ncbi:MAG TPA: FAD-binding protein [Candidatus Acidoferrales bacterium]|nr:FAD-binding protein [Candidatus Acidoferrales bacterium]
MDLSRYAIHGVMPTEAARPTSTEALAETVRAAHDARRAVVLWGGGPRMAIGEPPSRYDLAVDLAGLSGVVEHSAADLVCTVRAGTTLADLADALAPARQRWPVEVGDPRRATVGGTIASAAPSASRLRFQHPRDWVIGCTAVLGDGTTARAGGRVVKNVTGYDLTRLYSGSYGTLVALAEVSLKLVALDEATATVSLRDADAARLRDIALRVRAHPVEAIVLAVGAPADGGAVLHVRLAGSIAAVSRLRSDLARIAPFADADGDPIAEIARGAESSRHIARLAVAPGHEADHLRTALIAYIGAGVAYTGGDVESLRGLRATVEAAGGALVLERASLEEKRALGVWGRSRVPGSVARALKSRFDPRDVLAPGRMPA